MKIVVLDPGLLNTHGHHFHTDLALYQDLERRNIETIFLANKEVGSDIQSQIPVRKTFKAPAYPDRDGVHSGSFASDFNRFNQWVAEDLSQIGHIDVSADDIILVPTVRNIHLDGILQWYEALPTPRPKIFLRLMFLPQLRAHPADHDTAFELSRDQMLRWQRLPADDVFFIAETVELAAYFQDMSGLKVSVAPLIVRFPNTQPDTPAIAREPMAGPNRFLFIGEARKEKGAHFLSDAFENILEKFPKMEFQVQTSCILDLEQHHVEKLERLSPSVSLLSDALSSRDYDTAFRNADVVLLPYDPVLYHLRTSLIFLEAVGAGKPVLVTANTWMHQVLTDLGAPDIFIEDHSVESLSNAMSKMIARWPEVQTFCSHAAGTIKERHNASAFLDAVFDMVRPEVSVTQNVVHLAGAFVADQPSEMKP